MKRSHGISLNEMLHVNLSVQLNDSYFYYPNSEITSEQSIKILETGFKHFVYESYLKKLRNANAALRIMKKPRMKYFPQIM